MAETPETLTSEEVSQQVRALIDELLPKVAAGWHVREIRLADDTLNDLKSEESHPGSILFNTQKREAIICISLRVAERNRGKLIRYLVAHELAHLMLADSLEVITGATEHLAPAMQELFRHQAGWFNERLAHQIGSLLADDVPSPTFWNPDYALTAEAALE